MCNHICVCDDMGEQKMKEVIIRLKSDHIKVKGAEYVQDLVRCQDCKHWVYNFNGCKRNPCTEPWYATDGCTYGEREGE